MAKSKSIAKKEISELAVDLDKQELAFCHHYLLNGDRAAAFRHAGMESSNPNQYVYNLLQRPHIKSYIALERKIYEEEQRDKYFSSKYKKMNLLWKAIEEIKELIPEKPHLASTLVTLIAELNKMEGHYMAEKHVNMNIDINEELKKARERMPEFFVGY